LDKVLERWKCYYPFPLTILSLDSSRLSALSFILSLDTPFSQITTPLYTMSNSMGAFPGIPFLMLTDSYKISHPELYPNAQKMVAYGEFRKAYNGDKNDERIVFCGMRYIIETYVTHRWTLEEVDKAAHFFSTHGPGHGKFPFPRELFDAIATEMDGKFPVKIEALPEGSVCHPHVPVYQITAEGRFSRLVTFLETLLTMAWYPSTVATLSRRTRSIIERAYDESVDERGRWTLASRLHDFGFRGCTSVEQAVLGGCANLVGRWTERLKPYLTPSHDHSLTLKGPIPLLPPTTPNTI
jgi:nicotinic acid phosphoribosyltransferase